MKHKKLILAAVVALPFAIFSGAANAASMAGMDECPRETGVPNDVECKKGSKEGDVMQCYTWNNNWEIPRVERWKCTCKKQTQGSDKLTYDCDEIQPSHTLDAILE